jgi:hypothetical protein
VHTAEPEGAVTEAARKIVRRPDPELARSQVRTARESLDLDMRLMRQLLASVSGFATVAVGVVVMGRAE